MPRSGALSLSNSVCCTLVQSYQVLALNAPLPHRSRCRDRDGASREEMERSKHACICSACVFGGGHVRARCRRGGSCAVASGAGNNRSSESRAARATCSSGCDRHGYDYVRQSRSDRVQIDSPTDRLAHWWWPRMPYGTPVEAARDRFAGHSDASTGRRIQHGRSLNLRPGLRDFANADPGGDNCKLLLAGMRRFSGYESRLAVFVCIWPRLRT